MLNSEIYYLIFKYKSTVSPCIDIVTGMFFMLQQRRMHEQSLVAVQKWFQICLKPVVTDIIKIVHETMSPDRELQTILRLL